MVTRGSDMYLFKNKRFPRWYGPLIGVAAGGYVGMKNIIGANAGVPWYLMVLGGMLIGGLAGCLVFLLDPPPKTEEPLDLPEHLSSLSQQPSSLVGRVLALFGVLLCWFPFLGLVLNAIGYSVNRKVDDWAIWASRIGLAVSALVSVGVLVGILLD